MSIEDDRDGESVSPPDMRLGRPMKRLAKVLSGAVVVLLAAVGTAVLLNGRQMVGEAPAATPSAAIESASAVPDPEPTQAASQNASAGISEDQAVLAARDAAPQSADLEVSSAKVGAFEELLGPPESFGDIPPGIPGDRMVWVVVLGGNGPEQEGSIVVIDFLDGRLYKVWDFLPQ